jgi:transcriptional regulator with XRE-family HTH domain
VFILAKLSYVNVDRIKELSKSHGISLKYFCDLFGKTRTYLADVRSGKNKMDESELEQIAEILETTVAYLTDETDDPAPKEKEPVQALDEVEELVLQILRTMTVEEKLDLIEYLKRK